jgi:hypothetical protein
MHINDLCIVPLHLLLVEHPALGCLFLGPLQFSEVGCLERPDAVAAHRDHAVDAGVVRMEGAPLFIKSYH